VQFSTTITGIITAFASVLTALGLVITAYAGLQRSRKVETKIDIVHKIVNQQRTDMGNYQRALIRALVQHGIEVPADQSIQPVIEGAGDGVQDR